MQFDSDRNTLPGEIADYADAGKVVGKMGNGYPPLPAAAP
jgi:hypothetical protein